MRRLDWQLVRPDAKGEVVEPLQMAEIIRRLVHREARGLLSPEDRALLAHSEDSYGSTTTSSCEAVEAPAVEDDPHWQGRIIDEFGESDVDMDLGEYLEIRRKEPDCERCPYTSPYSLFPMDPCEFSAGALEAIISDAAVWEQAGQPMDPVAMRALATMLGTILETEAFRSQAVIDARDYLSKAIHFLNFWADVGFGILPVDIDDLIDLGTPSEPGPVLDDEESSEPTTIH
jgi:hypothetical protein